MLSEEKGVLVHAVPILACLCLSKEHFGGLNQGWLIGGSFAF